MSKFFVLFLVFVCVSGQETLVWKVGSVVNVTVGPEDAVYCKLVDNQENTVFDGFGQCRILHDRVTLDQTGKWHIWFSIPGTVSAHKDIIHVNVLKDVKPVVTSRVEKSGLSVIVTCSVPVVYEVQSCVFRDPNGTDFIASRGEWSHQEYATAAGAIRYESYAEHHSCALRLLMPSLELPGIWRCAVNINNIQVPSYDFFTVTGTMLGNPGAIYDTEPVLRSTSTRIAGLVGDALTMTCAIDAAIRYCYFWAPDGTVFNVSPSTSLASYEYVGNGFDAGECGIKFNSIWPTNSSEWSCNVALQSSENLEERRVFFPVEVYERMRLNYVWEGNSVVLYLKIRNQPIVDYCRFVRSDGLGFRYEKSPANYVVEINGSYFTCALTIQYPTYESDVRSWTVIAKVFGQEEELSMTTTWDFEEEETHTRGLSRTAAVLLWSFFGTLFVFLIAASCLPKRNREWTYRRAVVIRNSFRRQPQPQQQIDTVTGLPRPVHTDILTDLPLKV